MELDPIAVMVRVSRIFDGLGVPYLVGGSMASSAHGLHRLTNDIDFVADLQPRHVAAFVAALGEAFFADVEAIRVAIRDRGSFNLIHLETMFKVDVFPVKPSPWGRAEMQRRRLEHPDPRDSEGVYFATPEDTVLQKLEWYRMGGCTSDRQWGDITGVLKVQGPAIDLEYLHRWSPELGLDDLLGRALREAALTP